jgi:hypothetical protein
MLNAARKAKTTKYKKYTYITTAGICGPLLVSFASMLFDQISLSFLSMLFTLLFSLIMIDALSEPRKIEVAAVIKTLDTSKPLTIKDIFSQHFAYILIKKYTPRKL